MRTITQVAEELGVSRKKIYSEVERLKIITKKDGKSNYIEDSDFIRIKAEIEVRSGTNKSVPAERLENVLERDRYVSEEHVSDREYTDLKERIKSLEEQLRVKDEQLKDRDMQINGLIQSNINFSKALMPPETAITVEEQPQQPWYKRVFKKK